MPRVSCGPPHEFQIPNFRFLILHCERQQLSTVVTAADGDDDVLLAVVQVGHRRSALGRRHYPAAALVPSFLVVRRRIRPARPDGLGNTPPSPAMRSVLV